MTTRHCLALLLAVAGTAVAADTHHAATRSRSTTILPGLGDHHHPIATRSAEAQRFFDQGLRLVFAFNHEEAGRAFARAAELDPKAAMPRWGVALALGPNINMDVDPERERAAYEAVQQALTLVADAPPIERDYVGALALRYTNDANADLHALAVKYKDAMGALVRRYPDDLDAATLYAESAMDLRPWQLWTVDGKPADGTEEIVAVLESVLRRDPQHPGANHYYIHAVEASPNPERALPSAARLETLVPAAGHLVHMPAHIYMRTGNYAAAALQNERALAVDRAYLARTGERGTMYELMYTNHNAHFLAAALAMAGRATEASRAVDDLMARIRAMVQDPSTLDPATMPMAEAFMAMPLFVALRVQRFDDVLARPEPDARFPITHALWHFARGLALVASGRPAQTEREALAAAQHDLPAGTMFGLNHAPRILELAALVLDARLAAAAGDANAAIEHWTKAVAINDTLAYDEPADWYYPVRESLGAALLRAGRHTEAEQVFRADLERNPRNGRSLLGLRDSLQAQGRSDDAAWASAAFEAAWRDADLKLRLEDL